MTNAEFLARAAKIERDIKMVRDLLCERWAWVPGYGDWYEVSTIGRVRSYRKNHRGRFDGRREEPKLLTPQINRYGYPQILLTMGGKKSQRPVHRLVLFAFAGPCPEGMEAAHLNGNRADNRLENLEWVTHRENMAHQEDHGTNTAGARNGRAKLTDRQVREIRRRYAAGGVRQVDLAVEFGVSQPMIGYIVRGDNWAHLQS